jgi:hypothetical protein
MSAVLMAARVVMSSGRSSFKRGCHLYVCRRSSPIGPLDAPSQQIFLDELAALRSSLLGPLAALPGFPTARDLSSQIMQQAALWVQAGLASLLSLSPLMQLVLQVVVAGLQRCFL